MTGEIIPLPGPGQILKQDPKMVKEIIHSCFGEKRLDVQKDLDRIVIPTGGETTIKVSTSRGDIRVKEVHLIILGWRNARAYWPEPYGQGGRKPPACTSMDGNVGVGDPGGDCYTCAMSKFVKNEKGATVQPCRLVRQLVIARPETLMPELFAITPGSIRNVEDYFKRLATHGLMPHRVVTKVTLSKATNQSGIVYAQAQFERSDVDMSPEEEKRADDLNNMISPLLRTYELKEADYQVMDH